MILVEKMVGIRLKNQKKQHFGGYVGTFYKAVI